VTPKLRTLLLIVAVVLPLDQISKIWVSRHVSPMDPIVLIDGFFRITHARNPGMALGLFQDAPVVGFIALTLVALGLILSFFRRVPDSDVLSATALGLILAGALGNLIDRVLRGEVVDFLQFDLKLFVFPDFNFADSAIVIGVLLLLLEVVASEAGAGEEAGKPQDA
jgi:signal peptidase II